MHSLKEELTKKGGTNEDWNLALHHGLEADDLEWVDTLKGPLNAESYADDLMASGRYLEYECYDDRGREQGRAILKILGWDAGMPYTLNAEHVVASDGYYEWYAQHQLKAEKVVYHVCPTRRKKCSEKLTKGDGRIFIHLMRWRMVNPLKMKELEYAKAAALQILKEWVGGFVKATPVAAADVAPPEGPKGLTGLDVALKEAATSAPPQAPPVEQGDKGLRGSRAVGAFLHERAEKRRKEEGQKKGDGSGRSKRSLPKGSPERGRSREKKKKRKKGSGEGSDTSSSRSSMDFHEPSTRGGGWICGGWTRKTRGSSWRAAWRNCQGTWQIGPGTTAEKTSGPSTGSWRTSIRSCWPNTLRRRSEWGTSESWWLWGPVWTCLCKGDWHAWATC